jgi:hypothetical protein
MRPNAVTRVNRTIEVIDVRLGVTNNPVPHPMSEFSESYHLRGTSRKDAVALLERAGLSGFVFPSVDSWVTVLAEGEPFRPNESLIDANEGLLLHYIRGEDHGWSFALYRGKRRVCKYECAWETEVQVEADLDLRQIEKELGQVLSRLGETQVRKIFHPEGIEQVFEVKPAYAFAQAVGLTNLCRTTTSRTTLPKAIRFPRVFSRSDGDAQPLHRADNHRQAGGCR